MKQFCTIIALAISIVGFAQRIEIVEDAGKFGLQLENSDTWILDPGFKSITAIDDTLFLVEQKKGLGVYNSSLKKMVVPAEYKDVVFNPSACGGYYSAEKADGFYLLNAKGKPYNTVAYGSISIDGEEVSIFANKKYGYYFPATCSLTMVEYDGGIQYNVQPGIHVVKKGGKYGIINDKGKELSLFSFTSITEFELPNYLLVKDGKKSGLLSIQGKIAVPVQFDTDPYPHPLSQTHFIVQQKNKKGIWDSEKQRYSVELNSTINMEEVPLEQLKK